MLDFLKDQDFSFLFLMAGPLRGGGGKPLRKEELYLNENQVAIRLEGEGEG